MLGKVACTRGWDGENWQVRTEIQPERVCIDQPDSNLATLFWYWQERSMLEAAVPSIRDFDPQRNDLSWVDVTPMDPLQFKFGNHVGRLTGDWTGRRLSEHDVTMHAVATGLEYLACKEREYPTFVHIDQKIMGIERNYLKLTVPLADETGIVTRVVYAFHSLKFGVIHGKTD